MINRPHLRISPDSIKKRDTNFDGGGHTYHRSDYYAHGQTLIKGLNTIQQRMRISRDFVKDRAYIEVRLAPDEKLKDRYKNLLNNAQIIISDMINESTGFGYIKTENFSLLEARLKEYSETETHTGKSYFSFIEEIRPIDGLEKINAGLRNFINEKPNERILVIIETFSDLPREAREYGIVNQLTSVLNETDGKLVSSYIHSSGSVVAEVEVVADTVNYLVQSFDSIRSADFAPRIVLPRVESLGNEFNNLSVLELEGDAKVCIFDSGTVSDNYLFDPFIIDRIDAIPAEQFDTFHGNFVASRIIFRDTIQDQIAMGQLQPHARVLDVRVFGKDANGNDVALSESQLIEVIRQTVRKFHREIRVYNLSLGLVNPYTDETALSDLQVSRIAAELDYISKEKDVMFVIAAGNINSLYKRLQSVNYPDYFSDDSLRILPPAESFLGLTVGSVVTKVENGALGQLGHPSPFSRRGPGFAGTRKPDIVADGGNVTVSGHTDHRIAAVALGQKPGELAYDVGTSFAAPLVASYAAELFDRISDASANLVKALLIHFSEPPVGIETFSGANKYEHIGFGVPNLNMCLESLRSKVTYVFEGSIPQQTYVTIPFWVPTILARNSTRTGRKKLRVRITVVWNPITDRRKMTDYSLIHLYPKLLKLNEDGIESEVSLQGLEDISYRERFYPVLRIEKQFERAFSGGSWGLQLRMSHRWDVPDGYEQDFAALISVEDPQDQLDVYEEVLNEVGVRYRPMVRVR